jgi:hypothetical protein
LIGLVMIAAAVGMLFVSKPRQGQVVKFLRGRHNAQHLYAMLIIVLLATGFVLALTGDPR